MTSKKEQLIQVQDAIADIEIGGQEYQLGTRKLRRADLKYLYQREKELQAEIEAENGNNNLFSRTSVAFFDGR